jgi:hypothetical protein
MSELNKDVLNILFDIIFSIFVNNLGIFIWRIIWDTQDLYLKSNIYFNSIVSLIIAYILIIVVKCIQINEINLKFQNNLFLEINKNDNDINNINRWSNFKLKSIILVISFANINHWRCLWNFTIEYTNKSVVGILTIAIISFLTLILLSRLCSLVSLPFQFNHDCYEVAYQIQPASANHNYYLSLNTNISSNVSSLKL